MTLPILIGVHGAKRSGKSTVATFVEDHGYLCVAFAGALKRAAMDIYGLSMEQAYGSEADKEAIDPRWGLSPRQILQRFGTEVGRSIHGDTWIRALQTDMERMQKGFSPVWDANTRTWSWINLQVRMSHRFVVEDVRFENEADAIHAWGGVVWRVVNPRVGSADTHASERPLPERCIDATIVNDGSLADLQAAVDAQFTGTPR